MLNFRIKAFIGDAISYFFSFSRLIFLVVYIEYIYKDA